MSRLMFALVTVLIWSATTVAAPLKISVAEFKVTGAAGRDELKGALQSMLASRLAGENLQVVGAGEGPDMTVVGTYIVFGKVFSLDGQVVGRNGAVLGRAFEQGEAADEVIPAVGRLAQKLAGVIMKGSAPPQELPQGAAASPVPAVAPAAAAAAATTAATDIVRPAPVVAAKAEGDVVRPERKTTAGGLVGQRLDGVMIGLVQVSRVGEENRDLVVALEKELRYYRQGKGLDLLDTDKGFGNTEKIIAIDCADLDGDGVQELYVTALNGEQLASRVYLMEQGKFRKIAADLPYFFRAAVVSGKGRTVYAQEMGVDENFFGPRYELVKNGSSFATRNPVKLPRFANLYNVNQFTDKEGRRYLIMIHPDGYLAVFGDQGESVWKSSDKFGGSDVSFSREDVQNMSFTGIRHKKQFIEQRLTVTDSNEIIVPKNEGTFVIGDSRSFDKNSVYAFAWNGVALDELWHTKVSQNYLADYSYDSERKELVILEVVKKAGVIEKGASAIVIKRVE